MAVSSREDSPTVRGQHLPRTKHIYTLTVDSIDLDQVLDHRLIYTRLRPVEGDSIRLDPREGHGWCIGNFDAEDAYELGNRFPQSKPCSMEKP